jgi:hypothetical protein
MRTRPHATRPAWLSYAGCTVESVADERIWTAEELEQMTPDERHRIVGEGIVTDLGQVAPEFLERVRAKSRALLEERGVIPTDSA